MSCDGRMIGRPLAGDQDVVGRHHQDARFHLRFQRQRDVHGHLIAVEVGVERRADQRVQLDRLALDQQRLERLDAQAVERGRAVEQDRVLLDDLFEDVPHLGTFLLDQLLRALDRGDQAALFQLVVDERLEQLERHLLRQAALVQLQLGADDDDRTARVVDALAEQVLAEPPLLALEHVGQRLQRPLVGAGDGLAATAVVEQGVDRLLQHPLLVADDDLGSVQLLKPLEAVVAVDDAPVEVVQIRRREAATVEGDQRAQVGRDHRDHVQHHPLGLVARLAEGVDDLEALGQLLPLRLAGRFLHLAAQLLGHLVHVDQLEQITDRLRAHARRERVLTKLLDRLEVALLGQELAHLKAGLLRVDDDVRLAVEDLLQVLQRDVEQVADARRQRLEEPDVRDGRRQVDVPQPLAADLGLDHLDAALLAHDPAVLHALVLAAVALVVFDWAKDLRAEQTVALGLEGPVVDRLRLLHLTVRPLPDLFRGRERDPDCRERQRIFRFFEEVENVFHVFAFLKPVSNRSNRNCYSPPSSLAADVGALAAAAALALAATSRAMSSSVDSCLRGAFGSSISSTFRQSD